MQAIFAEESQSLDLVAGEKDCYVDVKIVAVGGGGRPGVYAGSGSGFIETLTVQINSTSPLARITVGPYILIVRHAGMKILQKQIILAKISTKKVSFLECMCRTSGRVKLGGNLWDPCSGGFARPDG